MRVTDANTELEEYNATFVAQVGFVDFNITLVNRIAVVIRPIDKKGELVRFYPVNVTFGNETITSYGDT
jgi:hypothetical protein